jgi:activator of HSP90 ATPase
MLESRFSRRRLALGLALLPPAVTAGARLLAAPTDAPAATAADEGGLSHSSEAIHQEVIFKASRERVYEALTDERRFEAVTRLSDALSLVTAPGAKPTTISRVLGGHFTLFGGYVTGRHLELVKNERLVQAWRAGGWPAGDYSVVRFALAADAAAGCRLTFDHRGFPDGQGKSLAYGWRVHYWEPLAKLLAQG